MDVYSVSGIAICREWMEFVRRTMIRESGHAIMWSRYLMESTWRSEKVGRECRFELQCREEKARGEE